MELRQRALDAFKLPDAVQKAHTVLALWQELPQLAIDTAFVFAAPDIPASPGRPTKPALVEPQDVPRRSPFTPAGLAALLHSITHIEFNAINLALDAIWRFNGMPQEYYRDWMQVAAEEAKHFLLLRNHLVEHGYDYGDFVAHDGLWTMCDNTRFDVVARMALVPRTMEARGLDATPVIQQKLARVGTPQAQAASNILDVILREEVGHVAIGNHWYHWLCQRDKIEPEAFYNQAARAHGAPRLKPPFNMEARRQAGFTEQELMGFNAQNGGILYGGR